MSKYIHSKTFSAKYSDVDFKDELKPSAILSFLQEVACTSADELGFGYEAIKPKGLGFITAATYVKMNKPIGLQDFTVNTWPTPPRHVIFERYYQMLDHSGEEAVAACSRWCLVDMSTFKVLSSSVLDDQDYSTYNTDKCVTVPSWKVTPFTEEGAEKSFSITIANSEYDHYMHVNNTIYANYVFNCFSVEFLSEHKLSSFLINYVKQTREGDTLTFYKKELEEEKYVIHGFQANGELSVSAEVVFE